MTRKRDQSRALLLNGFYRTVAPKVRIRNVRPVAPCLAVACLDSYFPYRSPRRVCNVSLALKHGCRQSLGIRQTPEAQSAPFSIEPRYKSVHSLEFVNNWSGRYPFAAWISTPSNLAPRTPSQAVEAYSCTYPPTSSTVSARGTGSAGDMF